MEQRLYPKITAKIARLGQRKHYAMGFWLDSYEDLFSDFDPRPYSRRQISDDFLFELKRRYREAPKGGFEVRFYVPKRIRDGKIEGSARKKMRDYFSSELRRIKSKGAARKRKGLIYLGVGVLLLTINGIFAWDHPDDRVLQFLGFILSPAGWFSAWTSFEYLLEVPEEDEGKKEFFSGMQKCNFAFFDLEEAEKDFAESAELKPSRAVK